MSAVDIQTVQPCFPRSAPCLKQLKLTTLNYGLHTVCTHHGLAWTAIIGVIITSHASIAYRKQLLPQRTVGTIGSVRQERTPSKETTGPAQTNTQSETL